MWEFPTLIPKEKWHAEERYQLIELEPEFGNKLKRQVPLSQFYNHFDSVQKKFIASSKFAKK